MEFINNKTIKLDKELNELDKFVVNFIEILERNSMKYVIVSGYVAILFGRSRATEDIDMIVSKISKERFLSLINDLKDKFWCINCGDPDKMYSDYLSNNTALRFSYIDTIIPNVEFKFPKAEVDEYTLANSMSVIIGERKLFISPLELQIAYKLFLGSEKDIEDARFLFKLFADNIDAGIFDKFLNKFRVKHKQKYLR